eukprot:6695303-Alexandrium_andersonii.AAC.1
MRSTSSAPCHGTGDDPAWSEPVQPTRVSFTVAVAAMSAISAMAHTLGTIRGAEQGLREMAVSVLWTFDTPAIVRTM